MSEYSYRDELAAGARQGAASVRRERAALTLRGEVAEPFLVARDDVYRYLLTLGLHPPQAQGTARELFLRLYAALTKGEKIENSRAWVFRVAHNLGLKVREQQNVLSAFDPDLEPLIASAVPDPERKLMEREKLLRIHRAVEGLSEQQKRCLFLRLEGLRYAEIWSALGISESAVGEFLRRAVTRLRNVGEEV